MRPCAVGELVGRQEIEFHCHKHYRWPGGGVHGGEHEMDGGGHVGSRAADGPCKHLHIGQGENEGEGGR